MDGGKIWLGIGVCPPRSGLRLRLRLSVHGPLAWIRAELSRAIKLHNSRFIGAIYVYVLLCTCVATEYSRD